MLMTHLQRHQYPAPYAFPMGSVVETRKAPSIEGASVIGSSHLLTGVRGHNGFEVRSHSYQ